jgi:ELWxxDGT repeat protein
MRKLRRLSNRPTLRLNRPVTRAALQSLEERRLLAGISLVSDLLPGADSSQPDGFVDAGGGFLFFTATTPSTGLELYRTDGTPWGTKLVKDINPGAADSAPAELISMGGGVVIFTSTDVAGGTEVWRSDGTSAGTFRIADINPGAADSSPYELVRLGNFVYFAADDGTNGPQLWRCGTSAGSAARMTSVSGLSVAEIAAAGTNVFLSASLTATGAEIYRFDTTTSTFGIVRDIASGTFGSEPYDLVAAGSLVYFFANGGQGSEPFRSDGTSTGTFQLRNIGPSNIGCDGYEITAVGSTVFFAADNVAQGTELYKSDGTVAGTALVRDIYPGSSIGANGSYPTGLKAINGFCYFTADDSVNGYELWRSDGTSAGTTRQTQIAAGSLSSSPYSYAALGSNIYTAADDNVRGYELWRVGDNASPVADLVPGSIGSGPDGMTVFGQDLIFSATVPGVGNEVYKLDFTAPQLLAPSFEYLTRQAITLPFTDNVSASLAPADFTLQNLTTSSTVPLSAMAVTWNALTGTATITFNSILADGNYRLSVVPGSITDAAANALTTPAAFDFYVLAGDASRDRAVNFNDLLVLASNYNLSGKTFAEGDFSYDGAVNFNDLLLLAANYNTSLAPPAGTALLAAPPSAGSGAADDDEPAGFADVLA